jgi:short-subunit dehydrogenase
MMNVVIFGATSAIAMECAKLMAEDRCCILLVARDTAKLEILKKDLFTRGAPRVELLTSDLADMQKHEELLSQVEHVMPDYNAVLIAYGVLGDQAASQSDFAAARAILDTNFTSVVSLLTPIANRMEQRGAGVIAVISSVAGDRGRQSNYIYGASKGGLNTYLQGLRNRLDPKGVQVLTIKPGFVDTPMTAHVKKGLLFAQPDAVARGLMRALKSGKDTVYLPWFWSFIMFVVKVIPEWIFKRLKF